MRKHSIFFVLFLLFVLSISVSAHPGRTDSNGGHYNRDTGEYHYHNGEYAGQNQDNDTYTYSYSEFVGPTFSYDYGSNDYHSSVTEDTTTVKNIDTSNTTTVSIFFEIFFAVFSCLIVSLGITATFLILLVHFLPEKAFWKVSILLFVVILFISLYITFNDVG